ncbi:signal transduction histidine kinase [Scleroderma yunnanense]
MTSRLAEPTTMRTRSTPHDDISKRPPPSPSNKAPPPKKLDARSRPTDEKNLASPKPPMAVVPPPEPIADKPIINQEVFDQILELDDEEQTFSSDMIKEYFKQAEATFKKMDDSFAKKDLRELSSLGHFLKGSSASIGVAQVEYTCEEIQHLGKVDSEDPKVSEDALAKIKPLLSRVKSEYNTAAKRLKGYCRGLL